MRVALAADANTKATTNNPAIKWGECPKLP
jgi:hypothetical protein